MFVKANLFYTSVPKRSSLLGPFQVPWYLVFEVEHVEADLEDFDLVILESGAVVDRREVDPLERLLTATL